MFDRIVQKCPLDQAMLGLTKGTAMRPLHNLDWSDLNTFLHVARNLTMAAAANKLKVDVTTVRRRIMELEESIGVPLLLKQGRSMRLSEEGERVYAIAARMEELSHELSSDATDASRDLFGVVRVSTMEGFGSFYLAPRLSAFVREHPELSVQLVHAPHILNLTEREADISINMMKPERGRFLTRLLAHFTVGLYGSPAYLSRAGTPRNLGDLAQHDFVTYVDDLISVPHVLWLPDVIEKPRTRFTCSSLVAQRAAVLAGAGLAMLPHFMVDKNAGLVRIMPDEINLLRDWWLVVHRDLQDVPRIRAVIDFVSTIMVRDRAVLTS